MLDKRYDEKCDVWSIGVITFIILCGSPPFNGTNEDQIKEKIMRGKFAFKQEAWKDVSKEAKDFISKLLVKDPLGRLNAQ